MERYTLKNLKKELTFFSQGDIKNIPEAVKIACAEAYVYNSEYPSAFTGYMIKRAYKDLNEVGYFLFEDEDNILYEDK